jgi:hypothetical protein
MTLRRRLSAVFVVALLAVAGLATGAAPAVASNLEGGHWAHDGLAHSQIYFVDHTGAFWPVTSATYKWNEARGVDSYYVTRCPSSRLHCTDVYEFNDPSQTFYGETFLPLTDGNGHFRWNAAVYLNDATVHNSTQARKTTCQELGHVLGLDHQYTNTTCMMQGDAIALHISVTPNAHDFDMLHGLYAHAN